MVSTLSCRITLAGAQFVSPLVALATLVGSPWLAMANSPRVQFDIAPLAVCHDITTAEFSESNPNERLLETTLEVSTLLISGGETDLSEFFFRFSSPGQNLLVADYEPKTTLASDYAGNINVEKQNESSRSAGVTVSGVWDHLIKIAGSGDMGSKDNLALRYELHSPKAPIMASGTISRGTGVYFKIRPSRQTALEGSRRFKFVLRAPATWRGDYLQVHCEAYGTRRGVVRDEPIHGGSRDFFVALYLAGDVAAKVDAERMARSEATLQLALRQYRKKLTAQASNNSVLDHLAAIWSPPREPEPLAELEVLLYSHSPFVASSIPSEMPERLGHALGAYLTARTTLRRASK